MPAAPPLAVRKAIDSSSTRVTRRCEIYEADGTTRWPADTGEFLLDGSVNVDYGRDERRTVDLRLDNSSGALIADPNGGFWYDKILKIFKGIEYTIFPEPKVNICLNPDFNSGVAEWTAHSNGTLSHVDGHDQKKWAQLTPNVSSTTQYLEYYSQHGSVTPGDRITLSADVYTATGNRGTLLLVQFQNSSGALIGSSQTSSPFPLTAGVVARPYYIVPIAAPAGTSRVRVLFYYRSASNASAGTTGVLRIDNVLIDKRAGIFPYFKGSMPDNETAPIEAKWEVQVGEFMIDRMSEPHFPNIVSITGRDYSKKCLTSKFVHATGFSSGTTIETVIMAIGQNAGIYKFLFPVTGKTLGRDFVFEAGVERWKAMTDIAKAYGYELFFDTQGFCVLQQLQDPSTSPVVATFKTGAEGNLASYDKSMNDSRIYNHMVVTGEATETIPVYAEAKNEQPNSPTRIARIGDRVYRYTSSFITTTAQAQDVADKFLKIHALEEYDVNIDSIAYPWLEAGDIVEFIDPEAGANQPKNFLLSSLTIPLGLGPMSCNAKRVAIVSG